MDSQVYLTPPKLGRTLFTWDAKFAKRQEHLYLVEDRRVEPETGQSNFEAFFRTQPHGLQPPQFNYNALREFLSFASFDDLAGLGPLPEEDRRKVVLLDQRRDPTHVEFTSRNWVDYAQHPPSGDKSLTKALDARELFTILSDLHRIETGAERRSIFINDLSPLCALAIALTVAPRYLKFIRDFMSRYITNRLFFGLSLPFPVTPAGIFAFEFHIPYYALRGSSIHRTRNFVGRRSGNFMWSTKKSPRSDRVSNAPVVQQGSSVQIETERFHEAQISVILMGIDEWVWTLICVVDTSFENIDDPNNQAQVSELDAPSGGAGQYALPVWNPREYFLLVLSRRMAQVTMEWENIVFILEKRLNSWEIDTFMEFLPEEAFLDDGGLGKTKEYTLAIQVLRLFANLLVKTLESWDAFAAEQLFAFRTSSNPEKQPSKISSHLARIEKDVSELRFLRRTLEQRIETFESRRSNIVNASALMESRLSSQLGRAAELQAKNIGLLTKVTVVFLPLSLITSVFSMSFIPSAVSWKTYLALIVPFTVITVFFSFSLRRLLTMFPRLVTVSDISA